jgi:aryl-alcohol dehydrogenase-like predicted oxidoreductase
VTVSLESAPSRVRLGGSDLEVSALGLGTMGMAEFYGPTDEQESIRTIHRALARGVNLIDTAYMYGGGRSEEIVGKALAGADRERVVLSTKCGLVRTASNVEVNGRPEHIRSAIDESLGRLGTDYVDLWYLHRVDPSVPVEESIGAMAEQVAAGKVRHLAISEADAENVRRAHATHPMSALQSEYSLCTREPETSVLPVCKELGITFVAWGPLGRGMLTGAIRSAGFGNDDLRSILPRFGQGSLERNLTLVDRIGAIAERTGRTPAQLALAWITSQGHVAIPGAMTCHQLEDNLGGPVAALDVTTRRELDEAVPAGSFDGNRFHAHTAAGVDATSEKARVDRAGATAGAGETTEKARTT